jgi:ABC-type sugar transport system permease subunit
MCFPAAHNVLVFSSFLALLSFFVAFFFAAMVFLLDCRNDHVCRCPSAWPGAFAVFLVFLMWRPLYDEPSVEM